MHGCGVGVGVPGVLVGMGVGLPGAGVFDEPDEGVPGEITTVLAEDTTLTCTSSVCERNSVTKSIQPLYIPGTSLPASMTRVTLPDYLDSERRDSQVH